MGSKILETLVDKTLQKYGEGSVGFLSDREIPGFVSTQCLSIDWLIGRPGIPLGRVTEISGWYSTGKSMLCCHILSEVQQKDGIAILMDTERSYTAEWFSSMGGNRDEVLDLCPDTLEDCFSMISDIVEEMEGSSDTPVVIVVDSVSALPTEAEADPESSGMAYGGHARALSREFRRITRKIWQKKIGLVFVSQLKERPGQFGTQTAKLGGHAVDYHAALSLQLVRVSLITEGKNRDPVGFKSRVKVVKTKLGGKPFSSIDVPFYFDKGVDKAMGAFPVALQLGHIKDSGRGWYEVEGVDKKFRESQWPEIMTSEVYQDLRNKVFGDVEN